MGNAIRSHLTEVICRRFPPGAERAAWLEWLALADLANKPCEQRYRDQPVIGGGATYAPPA